MEEVVRAAERARSAAEREEADAFDRRYELDRRAERALAALTESGRARAREWADADRRDDADRRFDPEPDEPPAPPVRAPRSARPVEDESDDDDDGPSAWLR